jgi:hypothetical protein
MREDPSFAASASQRHSWRSVFHDGLYTGLLSLREIFVTDDLRSYACTAYYQVSSLFVSGGKE